MSRYVLVIFVVETSLFDIQHQSFEVFAFGVVDADRMVGWLGELVEYAHTPPCLCRR